MRLQPTARLCRLAVAGLAGTGLLGHGLAMLLVAMLAPGPVAAAAPFYGEICAAAGPAAADASDRRNDGRTPAPAQGHLDACPVCTAFTSCGSGALPAPVMLPGPGAGRADLRRDDDTAAPTGGRLATYSRGPPAAV